MVAFYVNIGMVRECGICPFILIDELETAVDFTISRAKMQNVRCRSF
jgi:hypothetical protein